jgi:cobalt/nickel transport system permease protein
MKDRLMLLAYLAAVLLATSVHDLRFLAAGLVVAALLAGRRLPRILRRAALAILLFNSMVTVSYIALSLWQGNFWGHYVLLINLRVFLLTTMTFLLAERFNAFRAFAFSPSLLYLTTLCYSQVLTLRRLFGEFRQAFRSRSIVRPGLGDLYRHGAATAAFFLHKSVSDAGEIAQAMSSRGFFND